MRDLKTLRRSTVRAARQVLGIPDYETYVAQRAITHPGEPVMSFEEFFRERQDARTKVCDGRFGRFRCC